MSSDDERDEKELDLTSPEVVTKYKSAAEIVNSNNPHSRFRLGLVSLMTCLLIAFGFGICRGVAGCFG